MSKQTLDALHDAIRVHASDEADGDLPVGWVLMVKTAIPAEPDATGYAHFWDGDIDTRMGLLRIATLRTERAYMTETEDQ